jgi:hypothetical protein
MEIIIIDTVNACRAIAQVQVYVYHNVITEYWHSVYDADNKVVVAKVRKQGNP